MHLKRVIPCLDVDAGRVVKGTNFVDLRDAGDPVELAARVRRGGRRRGRVPRHHRDVGQARHDRRARAAHGRRRLRPVHDRRRASARSPTPRPCSTPAPTRCRSTRRPSRGRSCSTSSPTCSGCSASCWRSTRRRRPGGGWEVFVAGGRTPTGRDVVEWAREGVRRGAGEILLTSMDRDGTEHGYDLGADAPRSAAPSTSRSSPRAAPGTSSTSPTRCAPVRTRRWRRRSSTTASSPSARRSATSRTPASPSASSAPGTPWPGAWAPARATRS